MRRKLFTFCAAVSLVLCAAILVFFFGKRFGYDDRAMPVTPLYFLWWRADGWYWLSSGKVFGIDLEAVLVIAFAILPLTWLGWRLTGLLVGPDRPGRCPACGYDLRATPERCPECGTAGTMPASR